MEATKCSATSMRYEHLLTRAWGSDHPKARYSSQEFRNLLDAEQGKSYRFLHSREQQLLAVANELAVALKKLGDECASQAQADTIKLLHLKLRYAHTSQDLLEIIETALEHTPTAFSDSATGELAG